MSERESQELKVSQNGEMPQLASLPSRLRGLACRHAAIVWPELQRTLLEAAAELETR